MAPKILWPSPTTTAAIPARPTHADQQITPALPGGEMVRDHETRPAPRRPCRCRRACWRIRLRATADGGSRALSPASCPRRDRSARRSPDGNGIDCRSGSTTNSSGSEYRGSDARARASAARSRSRRDRTLRGRTQQQRSSSRGERRPRPGGAATIIATHSPTPAAVALRPTRRATDAAAPAAFAALRRSRRDRRTALRRRVRRRRGRHRAEPSRLESVPR